MDGGESMLIQVKEEVEDLQQDVPDFVKIKVEIGDIQDEHSDFVPSKDLVKSENSTDVALRMNCENPMGGELCHYVDVKQECDLEVKDAANTSIESMQEQGNSGTKVRRSRALTNVKVECEVCGLVCRDRRTYKLHVMDHTGRPFKCDKCDKSYKKSTDLLYHKKTHTGDHDIHCDACGKGFTVKSALRAHMRTHSKEKPYVCHICNKGFSHNSSLKPHVAMHSEVFPYECKLCPKKFKTNKNLNSHTRTHAAGGDKMLQCDFCPKYFKSKEGLKLHMIRHKNPLTGDHPNPLLYTCEQCGNSYKHSVSLKNHQRSHNGEKFACHKCGKSYITIKLLDIHVRNHTGETPYSCTVCEKKFKRRDSWLYHKTTHQNDRKTCQCDICDKVFVCKSTLRVHKSTVHSNGKPFQCDYCFQSYKLRYDLTRHLRKHKKKEEEEAEGKQSDSVPDVASSVSEENDEKFKPIGGGFDDLIDVMKIYKCKCKALFEDESELKKHKLNECELEKIGNHADEGDDKSAEKCVKEEVFIKTEVNYEDS